jgi:hypothetical protein
MDDDNITAAIALEIATRNGKNSDFVLNHYLSTIRRFAEERDTGISFQYVRLQEKVVSELRERGFAVEFVNGNTFIGWK